MTDSRPATTTGRATPSPRIGTYTSTGLAGDPGRYTDADHGEDQPRHRRAS